jgi:hypothetical protein
VCLSAQLDVLRAWNRGRDRPRGFLQPRIGLPPAHDQRRHSKRREARSWNSEVRHQSGIVRERMGDGFEFAPNPRHQPHQHDERSGDANHVLHEVLHRATAISTRNETFELAFVRTAAPLTGIVHVRRLIRHDRVDAGFGSCGLEGQRSSGRQAEKRRRPAGFLDKRRDVFDLARRRIRLRVAALPAAATVVREHGEVLREKRRELRRGAERAAAESAVYENQRRSAPGSLERNFRPVFRPHQVHDDLRIGSSARNRASRRMSPPQSRTEM